MYAVIRTGGKQYKVQEGDVLKLEKLAAEIGETVEFDQVLAVKTNGELKIGAPYVEGARVTAKVLGQGKAKDCSVDKPKKNYRKKQGHRQPFTSVRIEKIVF